MGKMLAVSGLEAGYGGGRVLSGLDLDVQEGEIVALLGANGAGKTTTMNVIAGLMRSYRGVVTFAGRDITKLPAYRVARCGLALVPEGRMVIAPLTVQENLTLSSYAGRRRRTGLIANVFELFPQLKERLGVLAGTLSGGEQQMLAIARALMTNPKMLLLDEPSMGLSPRMVDTVIKSLEAIRAAGLTTLLVEQNANLALPLADRGFVIDRGRVVLSGTRAELEQNPHLIEMYMGLDVAGEHGARQGTGDAGRVGTRSADPGRADG